MKQEVVLVVDVGTSKVHANIINIQNGALVSEAVRVIPWSHPQPEWTECDPEDIWQAVVGAVEEAVAKLDGRYKLIAVGNSFQGDGFLLEDKDCNPLYPVIVAMDGRGVPYVKDFEERFGADRFMDILGCGCAPWEPMKYYWMVQNRPELIEKTAHITSVQEYIMRRYGLGYCQDYTLASRKVMRDYKKNAWSLELCDFIGVPVSMFDSPIYASHEICGKIRYIGPVDLGEEVPVQIGGHDCEMGMLGVGVVPGYSKVLANVAGTTDHLGFITKDIFPVDSDKPMCIYRGPFDGTFVALGANAVGAATSWGVNSLFPERGNYGKTIADLFASITFDGRSKVVHTGGIQSASGSFHHVNLQTTREDIFKALVEGVTYPLKEIHQAMEDIAGGAFDVIRIGNGGAKSRSWVQLKADLFNTPVETLMNNEISSVGAAILAALELGRYDSLTDAQAAMIQIRQRTDPVAENVNRYRERVEQWKELSQNNL